MPPDCLKLTNCQGTCHATVAASTSYEGGECVLKVAVAESPVLLKGRS
jgi:hypothetical protein